MQTLIEILASIGIVVAATEAGGLTILSINQEWLAAACTMQQLEEDLAESRKRWYGSPEAEQADFHRMVMQAEAAWEEAEEKGYDLREDTWDD